MSRIQELEKMILEARKTYYGPNPEVNAISDEEYDALEQELRSLDPDSEILQIVGSETDEKRERLAAPMLSQEKALTKDDTKKIIQSRFIGKSVVLTEKLDGCGLDLTYVNGKLVSAITRGTWIEGTQVLEQALRVKNIPSSISLSDIKEVFHVRGEVVITFENFEKINKEQVLKGEQEFSNPRNLAAGTIKIDNLAEVERRCLQFVAYETFGGADLYSSPLNRYISNFEKMQVLRDMGFVIPELTERFESASVAAEKAYSYLEDNTLPYPIDGIVLKAVDVNYCRNLGATVHHPKGSFAIKPLPESKWVEIKKIDWTMSRRGVLSPTAVFDPVKLSGAQISRVMLFNLNNLERFNAYPGTKIKVIRSGLVIPRCIASDMHADYQFDAPSQIPQHLREQGYTYESSLRKYLVYDRKAIKETYPKEFNGKEVVEVQLSDGGVRVLKVVDTEDSFRIAKKVEYLLQSIRALGFGESILAEYCDNAGITSVSMFLDTFSTDNFISNIKTRTISKEYAEKLNNSLKQAIANAKTVDVIKGLGIERAVSIVEKVLKDMNSFDDLFDIALWRKNTTHGILTYIEASLKENREEFSKVLSHFTFKKEAVDTSTKLTGQSFVITGTLPVKRSEVEALIKKNGGLVSGSVSKRTTCLIAGEDCGSKLQAAEKLGVKIISYNDFLELVK